MLKWIIQIFKLLSLFSMLPPLVSGYLYLTYEHGNKGYRRLSGQPGALSGEFYGVFDTYQCGIDERHTIRYVIEPDSTGVQYYEFDWLRHFVGQTNIGDGLSVIPFDPAHLRPTRLTG